MQLQKVYGDKEFALGRLSYIDFGSDGLNVIRRIFQEEITADKDLNDKWIIKAHEAFQAQEFVKAYYARPDAVKEIFFGQSHVGIWFITSTIIQTLDKFNYNL